MGPMANPRRPDAIEAFIGNAVQAGARIAAGGERGGGTHENGFFFRPTVLTDVPLEARVMNEEPFGPLALMRPFKTFDEAIEQANRLPYGLAAYCFTENGRRALLLGDAIESGMIGINTTMIGGADSPFGGVKDSGHGSEDGPEGLEACLVVKAIHQHDSGTPRRKAMTELKTGGAQGYLRIATEEAFLTKEVLAAYKRLIAEGFDDPGFQSLWGFYSGSPSARAVSVIERLQDLDARRIGDMDAAGIDKAVIALTAPGTHVFAADEAKRLASDSNDQLAAACRRHPTRFIGMTAIAPQDPKWSAREIERGQGLGFKAVILNGHVHGEYTDHEKFWPIFEAAEALGTPVYLHPQGPSKGLIGPLLERGLDGAVFGFGVDTGLHLLRLIVMGVFDRFPKLKFVVGHGGEALPYWAYRLDYMHGAGIRSGRYDFLKPLARPSRDISRAISMSRSPGSRGNPRSSSANRRWAPIASCMPWTIRISTNPKKSPRRMR